MGSAGWLPTALEIVVARAELGQRELARKPHTRRTAQLTHLALVTTPELFC